MSGSGSGGPLKAAKRAFWEQITRLYNRHYGVKPLPETEIVRRSKCHYLIGEAGYPNYGDELIAREWVKYLAQVDPEVPVVLDCLCAGPAAAICSGLHPKFSVVDTVAQMCMIDRAHIYDEQHAVSDSVEPAAAGAPTIEEIPVPQIANRVLAALDAEGLDARYAAGIRLLNNRALDMHVIGGGYMHSFWNANLARLAVAKWAQAHGKPAVVSGVGLEPLDAEDAEWVADIASHITAFSCRDMPSLDAIDSSHSYATLAPDDCFVNGLEGVYLPDEAAGDLPETMVCVQTDLVPDPAALLDHMVAVLQAWEAPAGERVGVVECIPYDSMDALRVIRDHGWEPVLFPLQNLIDHGFPARSGQRWLSTRYHPHLLAAARGCSGTFIPVKPGYYDVKHAAVLRMGSRWTQTTIGDSLIPKPGPGFADPSVRFAYRDQIRAQVAPLYGEPHSFVSL